MCHALTLDERIGVRLRGLGARTIRRALTYTILVAAHDQGRFTILAVEGWRYPNGGRRDATWRVRGVKEYAAAEGWVRAPEG
ncbi:hypothetical protein GCM10010462_03270 [Microbacterium dextranolyticum]|uniref:Uncharacterized protein n=1 Tax=Microbacterium dextranolyticum TaxID=36806 RepID=A0A9W6M5S6_9MICO|nr:hypothetical protein GCM10017591_17920 [Microbacterium dextranolyticum]